MKIIKGIYGDMIPEEVDQVRKDDFLAELNGFTTSAAVERKIAAVEKYPEYFPWESKYRSIPQDVHDAFEEEAYPDLVAYRRLRETDAPPSLSGKGLLEEIQDVYNKTPPTSLEPMVSAEQFILAINNLHKEMLQQQREEQVEKRRIKRIWAKHYKKYNLKFYNT